MTREERELQALRELAEKRRAVNITLNWLEDDLKEEVYLETIAKLKKENKELKKCLYKENTQKQKKQ